MLSLALQGVRLAEARDGPLEVCWPLTLSRVRWLDTWGWLVAVLANGLAS